MTSPITIEKFELQGFRAYLQPQTVELHRGSTPLSLAVFAPNGKGKSSLVDSFEFYFSEEGTLARLGLRTADSHAGPVAITHEAASDTGINPSVHFWFREGTDKFQGERQVSNAKETGLTDAAKRLLSQTRVPFVIHGHELRRFVEGITPEVQYRELATWFGLDPLLKIQNGLRQLRRQVGDKAGSQAEEGERLRDLSQLTDGAISAWDEVGVISWLVATHLTPLDSSLTLGALSHSDSGYQKLIECKAKEDDQLGLRDLRNLLSNLGRLYTPAKDDASGDTGYLAEFEKAMVRHGEAVATESEERTKAGEAMFNAVWQAGKTLFETAESDLESCPICDSRLIDTPHGSHAGVLRNLDQNLSHLADYRKAETALTEATKHLDGTRNTLETALESNASELTSAGYVPDALKNSLAAVKTWRVGDQLPDSTKLKPELVEFCASITVAKDVIEANQGQHTYASALSVADKLIHIQSELTRIQKTKLHLASLNEELTKQALFIGKAIVVYTQGLITLLQNDVDNLYKEIQGGTEHAPPIYFSLPAEEERNQQRVQLLIDFSDNRKGVVPSGYLSDSQIHTLALSLRLAAIRLLNAKAPIIVLDDVVTSYDADHRKTIAAVLAKHFADFQIVVVTHDDQFFSLLKDHLPSGSWDFKRITEVKPGIGPVFHDHRTPDELIQAKLDSDVSAAIEIRQAEEEWLLGTCRDFRTKADMRQVERSFQYDRSELAESLARFLKEHNLTPPEIPGIANRFLTSLSRGVVENFASHFSDNPYKSGSVGDDRARWKEFKRFRDSFVCSNCGKRRFKRPQGVTKPLCDSCETLFAFGLTATSPAAPE